MQNEVSILRYFEKQGLNYTATASSVLSSSYNVYNPFKDDDTYFFSSVDVEHGWWQVSFSKLVTIRSYILKSKGSFNRPESWTIKTSDGTNWKEIHTISNTDIRTNYKFTLPYAVLCKYFRIIMNGKYCSTGSAYFMTFSFFDCFGYPGKADIITFNNFKYFFALNYLILTMLIKITS